MSAAWFYIPTMSGALNLLGNSFRYRVTSFLTTSVHLLLSWGVGGNSLLLCFQFTNAGGGLFKVRKQTEPCSGSQEIIS